MTVLSNEAALQMAHALREQSHLIRQQIALAKLNQPQWWSMEMLREHYAALTDQQILGHLHEHCGYRGSPGVKLKIHLNQVLTLDAFFEGRLSGVAG